MFACKWDLLEYKRNTSISAMDASDRFFNQMWARHIKLLSSGRKPALSLRRQKVIFVFYSNVLDFFKNLSVYFFFFTEFALDPSQS